MTTDELRAIAEAATPGPWDAQEPYGVVAPTGNIAGMWDGRQTGDSMRANRDFIATFNPDRILAMLDVIEAADDPAVYDVMSDTTMYPAHKRLAAALARLREVK